MSGNNMNHTFDERWQKLRDILEREERAQSEQNGVESKPWSDFHAKKENLPKRLSEALKRFSDHDWADADAEADFRDLESELDQLRALEDFQARNRQMLRGGHDLSFDEALELMREIERLGQMARNLLEGKLDQISLQDLRELAGEQGVESLLILRDMRRSLEEGGYLRRGDGGLELTPRAIGASASSRSRTSTGRSARLAGRAHDQPPRRRPDHDRAHQALRVRRAGHARRGRLGAERIAP
jgi:uncharacterized protein with von Willebrand factor type A (vWA) domain